MGLCPWHEKVGISSCSAVVRVIKAGDLDVCQGGVGICTQEEKGLAHLTKVLEFQPAKNKVAIIAQMN